VDFSPLPKGRLPEALINGLRQVKAGVNDAGPPLSALGLCWCGGGSGRVRLRLGMNRSPTGFPGLLRAVLRPLGEGSDRHHIMTL
jgi:hypothetical protein